MDPGGEGKPRRETAVTVSQTWAAILLACVESIQSEADKLTEEVGNGSVDRQAMLDRIYAIERHARGARESLRRLRKPEPPGT